MSVAVDYRLLRPTARAVGRDHKQIEQIRIALRKATHFLMGFTWCNRIKSERFGMNAGDIATVFFFEIEAEPIADSVLWVVTGKVPSAYLVVEGTPTPSAALSTYCDLMDEWSEAVLSSSSLADVYPVHAAPTRANAEELKQRTALLRQEAFSPGGALSE